MSGFPQLGLELRTLGFLKSLKNRKPYSSIQVRTIRSPPPINPQLSCLKTAYIPINPRASTQVNPHIGVPVDPPGNSPKIPLFVQLFASKNPKNTMRPDQKENMSGIPQRGLELRTFGFKKS